MKLYDPAELMSLLNVNVSPMHDGNFRQNISDFVANTIDRVTIYTKGKADLEWYDLISEFLINNVYLDGDRERVVAEDNLREYLVKVLKEREPKFILTRK